MSSESTLDDVAKALDGRPVYWNPETGEEKEPKDQKELDRLVSQGWEWSYDKDDDIDKDAGAMGVSTAGASNAVYGGKVQENIITGTKTRVV